MTLSTWIEKTKPKKVAQLLNVDPSTVSQWRNHAAFPRARHMKQIVALSKGEVSYKSIVENYLANQEK